MTAQPDAALAIFPLVIFILVIIPMALLLTVLPFWFICRKAGFPGALSLLMIVPIGNIVFPFVLAFADWPALKGVRK